MKIFLSPQVRDTDRITYRFEEGLVTATYRSVTDTFDFREFGDGILEVVDPQTDEDLIQTILDYQPIISAKRENGILYVEVINFIGFDASQEECFPEWIDHTEYANPRVGESSG